MAPGARLVANGGDNRMNEYRRRTASDVWHWETDCTNWPTENYVTWHGEDHERPTTGELCDQCKAKERDRNPAA